MKAEKIFLSDPDMAIFKCPECETARGVNIKKYKDLNKLVRFRVKCSCKHIYPVILEKRKYYRKFVDLLGHFRSCVPGKRFLKGVISVKTFLVRACKSR